MYAQLEPISLEEILGTWKGGKFDGGKDPDPIKWYGKRFVSAEHCEPLLRTRDDGTVHAYENLGTAQMRLLAYEGKMSAALIYDKHPIMITFAR